MKKRASAIRSSICAVALMACSGENLDSSDDPIPTAPPSRATLNAGERTLSIDPGRLSAFDQATSRGAHAVELRKGNDKVTLLMEQRRSSTEALERLQQIAREYPDPTTFLTIEGSAALERVRRMQALVPSARSELGAPEELVVITLAMVRDEVVVRLETNTRGWPTDELLSQLRQLLADTQLVESTYRPDTRQRWPLNEPPSNEPQLSNEPPSANEPHGSDTGAQAEMAEALMFAQGATPGFNAAVNSGFGIDAEIEVAVSDDGRDIVVVNNSRDYTTSNTFGQSFSPTQFLMGGPPANGDPSIAWAQSGAFYYAYIAFPDGTPASNGQTGCATGIHSSADNGQNFAYQSNAFLSPAVGVTVTFPDQEHIAADRVNASSTNQDQVYSVWRDFSPIAPTPTTTCAGIASGSVTPSIVCSADGAATWTARATVGAGDFPRVTVGPDGAVYVSFMSGNNVMLNKFSSCDTGLVQQAGMPVVVASNVQPANCGNGGIPGLNRCNDGNDLRSATVAVDESVPFHVWVAYAANSAANNENIVLQDSIDGGATWTRPAITLNSGVTGHRFMPWVCATGSTAFVSWYDMRAGVTGATNDLTEFFGATASLDAGGNLANNPEFEISQAEDPLCASGWAITATRGVPNSENCSVQPQAAGTCMGTGTRCDFSDCPGASCACAAGVPCLVDSGSPPKYGDYNGVACASGRYYAAWASATAPATQPQPADIDVFFACPPNVDDVNGTFVDTTPPFFDSFPANVTANSCNVGFIGFPVALDACGNGPPTVMNDAPAVFAPGATVVTWTATDDSGNAVSQTQTVTVVDTTPPSIIAPPDVVITSCATPSAIGTATAADDCGVVAVSNDAPAVFPLGATQVTWTAVDSAGNTATATQQVVAVLGDDPSCCPAGTNVILGTANPDSLAGTNGSDCILGGDGDDSIAGFGGNDFISGGAGDDSLASHGGDDYVVGGSGNDHIDTDAGNDYINGQDGVDQCDGREGVNIITNCETTAGCTAPCCALGTCDLPPDPDACAPAYAQSDCLSYTVGTIVSVGDHDWECIDGNCANCATHPSCAPGATGCPWGVVWSDTGSCELDACASVPLTPVGATSSSNESPAFGPMNAIDGNPSTRWSSAFSNPQWITVDLGAAHLITRVVLDWEAAFSSSYSIQVSDSAAGPWTIIHTNRAGNGGVDDISGLSGVGRFVRMHSTARGTPFGNSLFEIQVFGTASLICSGPLPLSSINAVSSSNESGALGPNNARDNTTTTRWSSAFSNNQWIYLDLGAPHTINRVVLDWEAAFSSQYDIQVSSNATTWTTIHTDNAGNGGIDIVSGLNATGRYVRMFGRVRGTPYGHSLWEFQVYGSP